MRSQHTGEWVYPRIESFSGYTERRAVGELASWRRDQAPDRSPSRGNQTETLRSTTVGVTGVAATRVLAAAVAVITSWTLAARMAYRNYRSFRRFSVAAARLWVSSDPGELASRPNLFSYTTSGYRQSLENLSPIVPTTGW